MDILVGIDFGTTNTVISYFENNKAHVLMDGQYKTIPSKIGKYNDKYYKFTTEICFCPLQ